MISQIIKYLELEMFVQIIWSNKVSQHQETIYGPVKHLEFLTGWQCWSAPVIVNIVYRVKWF